MSDGGDIKYVKLTRHAFVASDHLLSRSRSMFTESYKRFYFNEIQYIILQRTSGWHVRTILLLVLLAISMLPVLPLLISGSVVLSFESVAWGLIGVTLAVIGLVINLIVGPGCQVIMRTPVGTQRLYGATTMRRARKIIDRLNEEITKVQGPLQVEQVAAANGAAAAPAPDTAANGAAVAPGAVGAPDVTPADAAPSEARNE